MKNHLLLSILILCTFSLSAETIIEYHVSHWSEPELIDVKSNIPIHQVLTIGNDKFLLTKMREPQTNSEYVFYDLKNNTQIEYTWSFGNKAYSSKIRPSKNEVILIPNAGKKILGIPFAKLDSNNSSAFLSVIKSEDGEFTYSLITKTNIEASILNNLPEHENSTLAFHVLVFVTLDSDLFNNPS